MIIFFCFFYTAIVFNPSDTADNLKKHGGFIPGIRPGEQTAQYIDYVLTRITVVGAIYFTICLSITRIPHFGDRRSVLFRRDIAADCRSA
jgi:preprotein translocase subunit SecY